MRKRLSASQVETFHRDGFLSPLDVFSEAEAQRLRNELEDAERKWPEAFLGAARNNAHLNLTCLDEIAHNSALVDVIEDLIGPNILNYGTVLFIKEANDPGFVSWHQDATYMGLMPHLGITAWVALSNADEQAGCMRMIPGSHGEIRRHEDTFAEKNILTRGQQVADVDESLAVSTPLRPGQMSIHNATVIHSSQPNRSNDRRIGFVIQSYIPPEVRQTVMTTGAQLVRGTDTEGHFETLARPTRDMDPADVAKRDWVNRTWSDILYRGAEMRRDI